MLYYSFETQYARRLARKREAHCGNLRGASMCLNGLARYQLIKLSIYLSIERRVQAETSAARCGVNEENQTVVI